MKKIFLFGFGLLLIAAISARGEGKQLKTIAINEKDIVDWTDRLDENEVLYKVLTGFETDGKGNLYYLEGSLPIIYKVDMESGRLLKTISSRGQGPGELLHPLSMAVRNEKIFVYDIGFGGVKIFDLEGKNIKEFRLEAFGTNFLPLTLKKVIDSNDDNEIYLQVIDDKNKTCISVFDMNGKLRRTIIPINTSRERDVKKWILDTRFVFESDKNGDIIALYEKKGVLAKYDRNGKLFWEKNLYNDLPEEDRNKKKFKVIDKKNQFVVSYKLDFTGLCLVDDEDIFVSTYRGGLYYNNSGTLLFRVKQPSNYGFGALIFWIKDTLFHPDKRYKINLSEIRGKQ